MKVRNYLDIFNNEKIWKILRIFVQYENSYSGREMASLTKINNATATSYLEYLCDRNILIKQVRGKSYIYELKKNYYTQEVIIPLINQERSLYEKIKEVLCKKLGKHCTAIIVYGSYSRNEEIETSDLDVCLIVPEETELLKKELDEIGIDFLDTYSLDFAPHIFTEERVKQNLNMEVLQEIKNTGKWIYGKKGSIVRKLWLPDKQKKK